MKIPSGLAARVLSLSLLLGAGCGGGGGGAPGPGPSPSGIDIVSVLPADNATGVRLDTPIRVVFGKDMDPATLTLATISIWSGGTPVTGSLRYNTLYDVAITTGARDVSGTPLRTPHTWRFTTEAAPSSSMAGVLFLEGNAGVSYDVPARTATLDMNATYPLSGILVKAVKPSSDNSATIVAEDNTAATASGEFRFPGPLPGKWLIVAEKSFPTGPVRRILGVSSTNALGVPLLHYVPMKDVTPDLAIVRLDVYCSDCHPTIDNVTRPGQIYRDNHKSGIPRPGNYPPSVRYDLYDRVDCESCHSVHHPTGFQHYLLGIGGSDCNQCHHS